MEDIFQHVDDFEGGALEVLFDDLPYFLQIADQMHCNRLYPPPPRPPNTVHRFGGRYKSHNLV